MSDAIFGIIVYCFVGLSALMTILFLGMMIADDFFRKPHHYYKDHTK